MNKNVVWWNNTTYMTKDGNLIGYKQENWPKKGGFGIWDSTFVFR